MYDKCDKGSKGHDLICYVTSVKDTIGTIAGSIERRLEADFDFLNG